MKTKPNPDGWVYAITVRLAGDEGSASVLEVYRIEAEAIDRFDELNRAEWSRRRKGGAGKYLYSVVPTEFHEWHE